MAEKPIVKNFATSPQALKEQPAPAFLERGFTNTQPEVNTMNWVFYNAYQWIRYLEENVGAGALLVHNFDPSRRRVELPFNLELNPTPPKTLKSQIKVYKKEDGTIGHSTQYAGTGSVSQTQAIFSLTSGILEPSTNPLVSFHASTEDNNILVNQPASSFFTNPTVTNSFEALDQAIQVFALTGTNAPIFGSVYINNISINSLGNLMGLTLGLQAELDLYNPTFFSRLYVSKYLIKNGALEWFLLASRSEADARANNCIIWRVGSKFNPALSGVQDVSGPLFQNGTHFYISGFLNTQDNVNLTAIRKDNLKSDDTKNISIQLASLGSPQGTGGLYNIDNDSFHFVRAGESTIKKRTIGGTTDTATFSASIGSGENPITGFANISSQSLIYATYLANQSGLTLKSFNSDTGANVSGGDLTIPLSSETQTGLVSTYYKSSTQELFVTYATTAGNATTQYLYKRKVTVSSGSGSVAWADGAVDPGTKTQISSSGIYQGLSERKVPVLSSDGTQVYLSTEDKVTFLKSDGSGFEDDVKTFFKGSGSAPITPEHNTYTHNITELKYFRAIKSFNYTPNSSSTSSAISLSGSPDFTFLNYRWVKAGSLNTGQVEVTLGGTVVDPTRDDFNITFSKTESNLPGGETTDPVFVYSSDEDSIYDSQGSISKSVPKIVRVAFYPDSTNISEKVRNRYGVVLRGNLLGNNIPGKLIIGGASNSGGTKYDLHTIRDIFPDPGIIDPFAHDNTPTGQVLYYSDKISAAGDKVTDTSLTKNGMNIEFTNTRYLNTATGTFEQFSVQRGTSVPTNFSASDANYLFANKKFIWYGVPNPTILEGVPFTFTFSKGSGQDAVIWREITFNNWSLEIFDDKVYLVVETAEGLTNTDILLIRKL